MGRRARARGITPTPVAPAAARASGRDGLRLPEVRRVLTAYVAGATLLAVLVLLGIAGLGGRLGPAIVLAVALVWAGGLHRWVRGRLAGRDMADEDRVMQTMGGGMLFLSVCLSAAAFLLVTVVGLG